MYTHAYMYVCTEGIIRGEMSVPRPSMFSLCVRMFERKLCELFGIVFDRGWVDLHHESTITLSGWPLCKCVYAIRLEMALCVSINPINQNFAYYRQ